jgi:hypothetical protein
LNASCFSAVALMRVWLSFTRAGLCMETWLEHWQAIGAT